MTLQTAQAPTPIPKPTTISYAKTYAEAGYTIIKLNGKIPLEPKWTDADYVFPDDLEAHFKNHKGNFGVVLRPRDLVIDIDPRNFPPDDKVHVRLFKDLGITDVLGFAPIVKTGAGGLHVYLRLPKDFGAVRETLKSYPGIEFKSVKRQVVGAGSIHPDTKKEYTFANTLSLSQAPEAPSALLSLIQKGKITKATDNGIPLADTPIDDVDNVKRYVEYLIKTAPVAIQGENGDKTTYSVACVGRDYGLSAEEAHNCMSQFYNTQKCQPPWQEGDLWPKIKNAYLYATSELGNANPESQFTKVEQTEGGVTYEYDKGRKMKKIINNAYKALTDPSLPLSGAIVYDDFYNNIRIVKDLPWAKAPREWSDIDTANLRLFFSQKLKLDISTEMIDNAVDVTAEKYRIHPVRDYLNALEWDKKPRVEQWIIQCAGAEDNTYTRKVSKSVLMQACDRIFHPGCEAHNVMVLEGEQGIGKTSLIKILGGEWYGNICIDPHNKDTVDGMRGLWIIEMAEMEVTRRADTQALKDFITRPKDKVRLAYGRRSDVYLRQCVFIGSINPDATCEYLNDQTGNRRFWPIEIKFLNRTLLAEMRDQLFAEAMALLKKGEAPYIEYDDTAMNAYAKYEQKKRQVSDAWLGSVAAYVKANNFPELTTKDVFKFAIQGNEAQMTIVHQKRIAQCLRELNYMNVITHDPDTNAALRVYRYQGEKKNDK